MQMNKNPEQQLECGTTCLKIVLAALAFGNNFKLATECMCICTRFMSLKTGKKQKTRENRKWKKC